MTLIQENLNEEICTADEGAKVAVNKIEGIGISIEQASTSSMAWTDIEKLLSEEWEIGLSTMSTDAIRELIAGDRLMQILSSPFTRGVFVSSLFLHSYLPAVSTLFGVRPSAHPCSPLPDECACAPSSPSRQGSAGRSLALLPQTPLAAPA